MVCVVWYCLLCGVCSLLLLVCACRVADVCCVLLLLIVVCCMLCDVRCCLRFVAVC